MLNLITTLLPICYINVAVDVGNLTAVLNHEMAHCWGWNHPVVNIGTNKYINKGYKSYSPSLWWRLKGPYPNVVIQYEFSPEVLKLCNNMSAYGCAKGGLMK